MIGYKRLIFLAKRALGDTPWTEDGKNLLNPSAVQDRNRYISKANGSEATPSAGTVWRSTDYILVTEGTTYYFGEIPTTATTAGSAWYNEDKEFISGKNATELKNAGQKLSAPSGAKYLRHSFEITSPDKNVDWETTVYICVDGTLDHWIPYQYGAYDPVVGYGKADYMII